MYSGTKFLDKISPPQLNKFHPFQRVHSSSLKYGCEKCGRRFKWASSLGCHIRAAHSAPSVAWDEDIDSTFIFSYI